MNLKGEKVIIKKTNEEGVVMGKEKGMLVIYIKDTEGNLSEVKNMTEKDIIVKRMGEYGQR